MPMTTKEHLGITLQIIKKLLSFKANKEEVVNRNEIEEIDAVALMAEADIVQPVADENNAVFLDENNAVYIL